MDLCELIEHLYGMLDRNQWTVCSVTRTDFSSKDAHLIGTLTQSMYLEDTIPILFQADIDQYSVTDVLLQNAFSGNYHITIRLTRCI